MRRLRPAEASRFSSAAGVRGRVCGGGAAPSGCGPRVCGGEGRRDTARARSSKQRCGVLAAAASAPLTAPDPAAGREARTARARPALSRAFRARLRADAGGPGGAAGGAAAHPGHGTVRRPGDTGCRRFPRRHREGGGCRPRRVCRTRCPGLPWQGARVRCSVSRPPRPGQEEGWDAPLFSVRGFTRGSPPGARR